MNRLGQFWNPCKIHIFDELKGRWFWHTKRGSSIGISSLFQLQLELPEKWIGLREIIKWPLWSLDLTLVDFLWSLIKLVVYSAKQPIYKIYSNKLSTIFFVSPVRYSIVRQRNWIPIFFFFLEKKVAVPLNMFLH